MECELCKAMEDEGEVFHMGELSFAIVIHHPNTEFHCLVLPKRHVTRLSGLRAGELKEMFDTMAQISSFIEASYPGSAVIALNRLSNSTQPHLHFHVFNSKYGGIRAFIAARKGSEVYPPAPRERLERLAREYRSFNQAELMD